MTSVDDPFRDVDWRGMPPSSRYTARDGGALVYRLYRPAGQTRGSVVLIHGSSGRGSGMHVLGRALAEAGYAAYALDVRGHGDSGPRGRIGYVGQLEDDLEDFMRQVAPAAPATLAGFSAGGGFALRFAGDPRQALFANYLLLSPFVGQDAPTYRPASGGWVSVGVPRAIAINLLNRVGIASFNDLPITRFALSDTAKAMLTPQYTYALATNFRPQLDWQANIHAARQPMRLVVGRDDDQFYADRFDATFKSAGRDVQVLLLDGIGHIGLTVSPVAVQAIVQLVQEARPQ